MLEVVNQTAIRDKSEGTKSFLNLVEEANLKSPFADGVIKEVVDAMVEQLATFDDSEL